MCIPYVYKIKHKITKLLYVGVSYSKKSNPNLFMTEKGYKTSSKKVHAIIKEEGLQIFNIEKIIVCKTPKYAISLEKKYLQWAYKKLGKDSFIKIFINRNLQSQFIHDDEWCKNHSAKISGQIRDSETRLKVSLAKKIYWQSKENRINAGIRTNNFFSIEGNRQKHSITVAAQWTESRKQDYSNNNPSRRPEVKEKVRLKRLGMKWWNNGIIRAMSKECPGKDFIIGYLKREVKDV
jgi:hypothetical protein